MAHAQKPDFVFLRNGSSPFKSAGGRQFSRLLAAEMCPSAVVMLDTPCSEVVWRVLATHSIRQFLLHFPSCASPCGTITFQLESTYHFSTTTFVAKRNQVLRYTYVACLVTLCNCSFVSQAVSWQPVIIRQSKKTYWTAWPLRVGPIGYSETSVKKYRSTTRNIPEERIPHLRRDKNLELRVKFAYLLQHILLIKHYYI